MEKLNQDKLEAIVDSMGLYGVVAALERICYEKANHLATNWQDAAASRNWEKAGQFDRSRFLYACKPGSNVKARTAHLKIA